MNQAIWAAKLEIRQVGGAREMYGRFPYGAEAVVRDRGVVRKERFEAGAFAFALDDETRAIDLLVGHDFGKPIANRQTGSLVFTDDDDALEFVAQLPDDPPSWVLDAERAVAAGLMAGLSPGFRVPPRDVVANAERIVPEPGNPEVSIRSIRAAVLREMSIVTNAAYVDAAVELRADDWNVETPLAVPRAETLWL